MELVLCSLCCVMHNPKLEKKNLSWMHALCNSHEKQLKKPQKFLFCISRALCGIWSPAMKIKTTVTLSYSPLPLLPDPFQSLGWCEGHYKNLSLHPCSCPLWGGRGDCAMFLQILTRKWERLCSTIKPEGAARSGAQQCLLPIWLGPAERAAIGHRGGSLSSNQSWRTWLQNDASFELCQIPTIATGQKSTSAILWNKIQT